MKPQLKSQLNATALFVMVLASLLTAQTKITPPKNSYSVEQDIQLGREAAAEVQKQLPYHAGR